MPRPRVHFSAAIFSLFPDWSWESLLPSPLFPTLILPTNFHRTGGNGSKVKSWHNVCSL